MKTFTESVETFLESATWLGPEDQPAVVGLQRVADELDNNVFNAATLSQFRLLYNGLVKRAPSEASKRSVLDSLLDEE